MLMKIVSANQRNGEQEIEDQIEELVPYSRVDHSLDAWSLVKIPVLSPFPVHEHSQSTSNS